MAKTAGPMRAYSSGTRSIADSESNGTVREFRLRHPGSSAALGAITVVIIYVVVLMVLLFVGHHVTLLNESQQNTPSSGGLNAVFRELIGRGDPGDLLIDYVSAHALIHGGDPYGITAQLLHTIGLSWPVETANPHPPTVLTLVLPTMFFSYPVALAAWELAMIFVLIGTARVLGMRLSYAIPLGIAIGLTFPGAYGIGNVVPIIGLGIAISYRWRNSPIIAGLGISLAAVPKASGLLLVVPFVLSGRLRAVGWTALWYGLTALVPVAFDHHVWNHYFKAGVAAVNANANRGDNASLLHLGRSWGLPDIAMLAIIGAIICLVAVARRDLFWPVGWAVVVTLPIAWMYSLLTFLPLIVWAVLRSPRRSAGLAFLAGGLSLSSPPLGQWPTVVYPIVTVIVLLLLITAETDSPDFAFWLPPRVDPFRKRSRREPAEIRDVDAGVRVVHGDSEMTRLPDFP